MNPAKRVFRNSTSALHRAHSGVTPELLSTLGFIDEQQYERLYRAQAIPVAVKRRRVISFKAKTAWDWKHVRPDVTTLLPAGLCGIVAIALLFMAPRAHASEERLLGVGQRPLQFVVVAKGLDAAAATANRRKIADEAAETARMRLLAAIPSLDPTNGGEVTSGFGYRTNPSPEFHRGIDLAEPTGHPVAASADGVVTFAGWSGGFGNKVEIDHGNGYSTWYGHLSHIDVTNGQHVARGSVIAEVGETGEATGPHLHYQIMLNGVAIDPTPYMKKVPNAVLASIKAAPETR